MADTIKNSGTNSEHRLCRSRAEASPAKRVLGIIKNILTGLVVAIAVCMMIFTIVSVTAFNRNDRSLFGYRAYIVRSDSMSYTDFNSGDLILVKEVDPSTLKEGDIISFTSLNAVNFGEVVTHKIRSLTTTDKGEPAFITYGTTTNTDDEMPVTYEYILGQYRTAIPVVGRFFTFLKTIPGYVCCILLPFLILIIIQGVNSVRLFRQYKQEQNEALQVERAQIAAEREEIQRMMAELKMMRSEAGITDKAENSNEATAPKM